MKYSIWFLAILLISCTNISFSGKGNDVPTAGEVLLLADAGDSFMLSAQLDLFHAEYPKANVRTKYLCEAEILKLLAADSARFALMNRDFTKEERQFLESRDITIRSVKIAGTAIAIIVHPTLAKNEITQNEIIEILRGEKKNWGNGTPVVAVFDGSCGSNYLYMSEMAGGKTDKTQVNSVKHPISVIEFVAANKGAIGFVNVSWLSDRTDSMSSALVKKVKVLAVENERDKAFYLPFQSQVSAGTYPFIQSVFMHDLHAYTGLAHGLTAWISSQPGQIIVKKCGLVPATDHGRTIQIREE